MGNAYPPRSESNDSDPSQAPASSAGDQQSTRDAGKADSAAESFNAAVANIAELAGYLRLYVTAKLDALKLTALRIALYAIVAVLAGLAILAIFFTTVVLLCMGIADCFAALFHSRWLGELTAAFVILGAIALTVAIAFQKIFKMSYSQTRAKYEARLHQMRQTFPRRKNGARHE